MERNPDIIRLERQVAKLMEEVALLRQENAVLSKRLSEREEVPSLITETDAYSGVTRPRFRRHSARIPV